MLKRVPKRIRFIKSTQATVRYGSREEAKTLAWSCMLCLKKLSSANILGCMGHESETLLSRFCSFFVTYLFVYIP